MTRLGQTNKKATLTHTTTLSNCSEQKSILECTVQQTLRQMDKKQQKTLSGSHSINQDQRSEAAIGTDSLKLSSYNLKKCILIW